MTRKRVLAVLVTVVAIAVPMAAFAGGKGYKWICYHISHGGTATGFCHGSYTQALSEAEAHNKAGHNAAVIDCDE